MSIQETANEIAENFKVDGAIIILQKKNDLGQIIGVSNGIDHLQIRECLCIANYYNEKKELDKY